jgi:hypothetical protein
MKQASRSTRPASGGGEQETDIKEAASAQRRQRRVRLAQLADARRDPLDRNRASLRR